MSNGTNIGQAYVQIIPSAEGIKGGLEDVFDAGSVASAGQSIGSNLGSTIMKAAGAVMAGIGIKRFFSSALGEGGELQQSIGGVETLFGDASQTVIDNAYRAFETAGVSANDYMQNVTSFSATLLQGLGGDTARAAEIADVAMRDMSDNANKMGTNMGAIQNAYQGFAKDNYTMLDNLKLGYGGTASEMARLINETGVLGEGIEVNAQTVKDVPFDKIVEAIHAVQVQLGIVDTTSMEAAGTYTGSMMAMKAAWSNLMADMALGNDISGTLEIVTQTFSTFLTQNMLPMITNVLNAIPQLVSQLAPAIIAILPQIVSAGTTLITTILTTLITSAPLLVDAIIQIATACIDAFTQVDWGSVGAQILEAIKTSFENNTGATIAVFAGFALLLLTKLAPALSSISSLFTSFGGGAARAASGAAGAASSFSTLAGAALIMAAAGAAIFMIAEGMSTMADAAIRLSDAGGGAVATFVLIAGVGVGMAAAIVAIGTAAEVSAVGLLALSAAVLAVSAGISLVILSLTLFVEQLPTISEYGLPAAEALLAISVAILAVDAAALLLAVSIAAMGVAAAAAFLPFLGVDLTIAALDLAMVGLDATMAVLTVEMGILEAALLLVAGSLEGIKDDASEAATSLAEITDSVSIIEEGLDAIGDAIGGLIGFIVDALDGAEPDAVASATALATGITTAIDTTLNPTVGNDVTNAMTAMKTSLTTGATQAQSAAQQIGQAIVRGLSTGMSALGSTLQGAYGQVVNVINAMRNAFASTSFRFNSYIPLPHFYLAGSFDARSGSVPSVGVSWYAKAAEQGALFTTPQIIGVGDAAQGEVLLGEDKLRELVSGGRPITVNVYGNEGMDVRELADAVADRLTHVMRAKEAVYA